MKIDRRLAAVVAVLALSGCYSFKEAPYKDGDLKNLQSTEFGAAVLKYASKIPDTEYTADLKKTITRNTKVREISSDFLITQSKEDGEWQLSVMMRNSHHIMFCSMMESEVSDIPSGVNVAPKQGALAGGYSVTGDPDGIREFADIITTSGPKLCISIPYADPRDGAPVAASGSPGIIATVISKVQGLIGTVSGFIGGLISSVL